MVNNVINVKTVKPIIHGQTKESQNLIALFGSVNG